MKRTRQEGEKDEGSRENVGARMGNFILLIKVCKGLVKALGLT